MEKQISELEAGQKNSEDLILRLSQALKIANERNENLQRKLDQALKLQNDSHETICGILEKKMEEIEEKHQEFIKSMGEIMSKTVEGFESSQNNLEKKMIESEDLLLNTVTEVALLKISLNEHQKNILWKKETMALDLTANSTVISTEGEDSPIEEETLEEDRCESVDDPHFSVKNEKKAEDEKKSPQQDNSVKSMTERVLDTTLIGGFAWGRSMVSVSEEGDVLVGPQEFLFSLESFLKYMKCFPLAAFPGYIFEIECRSCKRNFVITQVLDDRISAICTFCKEATIISALPQPGHIYLRCSCSHAVFIRSDDPTPLCRFCRACLYIEADEFVRIPFPSLTTPEKQMERMMNLPHLDWAKPHVSMVDNERIRIRCCLQSTCKNETVMDASRFVMTVLFRTWEILPSQYEVDCWKCKKIVSLHALNSDKMSVKCANCKETIVIITGNEDTRPHQIFLFSCGHHSLREDGCSICNVTKKNTLANKKIRVARKKGKTVKWTWPEYLSEITG